MPEYHLAQVNLARMRHPLDSAEMAEFVELLAPVNAAADAAPGFVWRLQGEAGDNTYLRPYDDDTILFNMSVWASVEALKEYVYKSDHAAVMRRRREWFSKFGELFLALWWVPAGHVPSVAEAKARLEHLRAHGPSPSAFTFQRLFPPEEKASQPWTVPGLGSCPA